MACVHNLCGNQACRSATMPFQDEVLCERWLILLGRSGDKDWFTHKKGKPKLKEGSVLIAAPPHFNAAFFYLFLRNLLLF